MPKGIDERSNTISRGCILNRVVQGSARVNRAAYGNIYVAHVKMGGVNV